LTVVGFMARGKARASSRMVKQSASFPKGYGLGHGRDRKSKSVIFGQP
jgi:hypothetical protein